MEANSSSDEDPLLDEVLEELSMDPLNQDDIKTMRDKRKKKLAHRKLKKKAVAEKQAVADYKKKKTQAAAPNPDEQPKKK